MSGNRSAPKNAVIARQHREGQMERRLGIDTLTSAERRKLLDYIEKSMKSGGCQHLIRIHKRVPHPKYGDKVAHFETVEVPDPLLCPCEEARAFRDSLGG